MVGFFMYFFKSFISTLNFVVCPVTLDASLFVVFLWSPVCFGAHYVNTPHAAKARFPLMDSQVFLYYSIPFDSIYVKITVIEYLLPC